MELNFIPYESNPELFKPFFGLLFAKKRPPILRPGEPLTPPIQAATVFHHVPLEDGLYALCRVTEKGELEEVVTRFGVDKGALSGMEIIVPTNVEG